MGFCCQLLAVSARRSRATSRLAAIVSKVQMRRISAVGIPPFERRGIAAKRWWKILLSRKRFIICAEGTRILNGLPLILASLHTVAPLVRERLRRSRTLHRSQANGPPLFEERYSLRRHFSVFCTSKKSCYPTIIRGEAA